MGANGILLSDILTSNPQNYVTFEGDNTGTTDVVASLKTTIEQNPGKTIFLPAGTYKFSSALDPDASINLVGAGPKSTIIKYPATACAIITNTNLTYQINNTIQTAVSSITTALAPDDYAFTVDTDMVHVLNVASAVGFYEGDIVCLTASDFHPAGSNRRMGECIKVLFADVPNNKLYLVGKLAQGTTYYTTNLYVNKIDTTRTFYLENIGFTADGVWDDDTIDNPGGFHNHAVTVKGIAFPVIRNCEFNKLWEGGISLDLAPFSTVESCSFRQLVNLMTASGAGLDGRLGYGVHISAGSVGTIVRDCDFTEGRHCVTTDGHADTTYTKEEWYAYPQPTHITVSNIKCYGSYGPAIDTHEELSYATFYNCDVVNPMRGSQAGSYRSYGMQLRGSNITVMDYKQTGGQYGIRITATERLPNSFIKIDRAVITDLVSSSDVLPTTASSTLDGASVRNVGVLIDNQSSITNIPEISINRLEVHNANQGLVMLGYSKVVAGDLKFNKCGAPIEILGNCKLIVTKPIEFNFVGTTRTPTALNCINMWSLDSAKNIVTGSKVFLLDKPIIIKDSATKPVSLFNEADTSANKTYWADGIVELNEDSVTATTLVNSGSTTMVESTAISKIADKYFLNSVATTKGDLIARNSTALTRLPSSTDGFILQSDTNSSEGVRYTDSPARITLRSGSYLSPMPNVSATGVATGKLFFIPIYVKRRSIFTAVSLCVNNAASITFKTGIYIDSNGSPGSLVAGSTVESGAINTTTTNIKVDNTFSTPITLNSGWYWLSCTLSGTATIQALSTVDSDYLLGAVDTIPSVGTVAYVNHTYANNLPDPAGSLTFASQSTNVRPIKLFLKKQ